MIFRLQTNYLLSESPVPIQFTPFLGVLAGTAITLLIIVIVVVMVIRLKHKRRTNIMRESCLKGTSNNKSFKFDTNNQMPPKLLHINGMFNLINNSCP